MSDVLSSTISLQVTPRLPLPQLKSSEFKVTNDMISVGTFGKVVEAEWTQEEKGSKPKNIMIKRVHRKFTKNHAKLNRQADEPCDEKIRKHIEEYQKEQFVDDEQKLPPMYIRFVGLYTKKNLSHDFLVKLHGYYVEKNYIHFVMERANSNLYTKLKEETKLDKVKDWNYWLTGLLQIAESINDMHSRGIVCCNIHDRNTLIFGDRFRLSDCGIGFAESTGASCEDSEARGELCRFSALEVLQDNVFTDKTDIYSYGMIMFEVLTGEIPFWGLTSSQVTMRVQNGKRPNIPEDCCLDFPYREEYIDLMKMCWDQNSKNRPGIGFIKWYLTGIKKAYENVMKKKVK